jgi:hypothetical protein
VYVITLSVMSCMIVYVLGCLINNNYYILMCMSLHCEPHKCVCLFGVSSEAYIVVYVLSDMYDQYYSI